MRVNFSELIVRHLLPHHESMQVICGRIPLNLEQFANLCKLERLINAALMLSMCRIKVILNAIVASAWQLFCNVGPLVAELLVQIENFALFVAVDGVFFDVGVQVIVPPKLVQTWALLTFLGTACLCALRS